MNKKGFTLVELLAVIALIGILSLMAVPNVISSINNSRKNAFLLDAKRMISKAEYLVSLEDITGRNQIKTDGKIYRFSDLNKNGEFQNDADGGEFASNSFVKVYKSEDEYKYCICVLGSKRKITGTSKTCDPTRSTDESDCELSSDIIIKGIDVVKDLNE